MPAAGPSRRPPGASMYQPRPISATGVNGTFVTNPATGQTTQTAPPPGQQQPVLQQLAQPAEQAAPVFSDPAPPPAPMLPPAMPDFNNEAFMKALTASRGNISTQLQNAIAELGRQNTANQGQVAGIPGALDAVFNPATQNANANFGTLNQALSGSGLQGLDAGVNAPLLQALLQQKAIFGGIAPILSSGFNELTQRQTGGANALAQTLLADVDAQGNKYIADRETEERGYGFQAGQSALDRQFKLTEGDKDRALTKSEGAASRATSLRAERDPVADAIATYGGKLLLDKGLGIENFAPKEPSKIQQTVDTILKSFGPKDTTAGRGAAIVQAGGADYDAVKNDPAFQAAVKKIGSDIPRGLKVPGSSGGPRSTVLPFIGKSQYGAEDVIKDLEKKGKHRSAAVIRALYTDEGKNSMGILQDLLTAS